MTKPIHAQVIDRFNSDKWSVLVVTDDGILPVSTAEGEIDMPYHAGDVLLAGEHDEVICGPVSLAGAIDLAERVLDCNMRVRTDPRTLLILATALAALADAPGDAPIPVTPALAVEPALASA